MESADPPVIQYAVTADGARVGMASFGKGPPAVIVRLMMGGTLPNLGPGARPWQSRLQPHFTTSIYDPRGFGVSDRNVESVSLESAVDELRSVMDTLRIDAAPLLGFSYGVPVAVQFAAQYPERVTSLAMYGGFLRGGEHQNRSPVPDEVVRALRAVVRVAVDDELPGMDAFRSMLTARFVPGASPQEASEMAASLRGRSSPDVALKYLRMLWSVDLSASAQQVKCPVLIFHAIRDQIVPVAEATHMASRIPGARLVLLDDDNHVPFPSNTNWPTIEAELARFFAWSTESDAASSSSLTPRQLEVLRLIGQGCTDKEIGRKLAISPRTVEMHVAHAMRSLGSKTRAEAAAQAARRGLTQ